MRNLKITQFYRTFRVDLGPRFIKSGLKSTQKSPPTLPSISGLRTNWDKFGSAQETETDGIEAAFGRPASQLLCKLGSADAITRT